MVTNSLFASTFIRLFGEPSSKVAVVLSFSTHGLWSKKVVCACGVRGPRGWPPSSRSWQGRSSAGSWLSTREAALHSCNVIYSCTPATLNGPSQMPSGKKKKKRNFAFQKWNNCVLLKERATCQTLGMGLMWKKKEISFRGCGKSVFLRE